MSYLRNMILPSFSPIGCAGGAQSLGPRQLKSAILALVVLTVSSASMAQSEAQDGISKTAAQPKFNNRIRGLVMPRHHATISSRLAATIEKIGPDNGERFAKNDVLVKFDCAVFIAEQARAVAQSEAAADAQRVKSKLAASGSVSKLQAVLAKSEYKRALAEVRVADEKVRQCEIRAPFSGRVVRRIANPFETANFRDPLIEIVSDRDVEIRAFVPSAWIRHLQRGSPFEFEVDETGERVRAEIIAIGAWIDNVSQLLEVRARVVMSRQPLLAGMSGRALFENVISTGNVKVTPAPFDLPNSVPVTTELPRPAAPEIARDPASNE